MEQTERRLAAILFTDIAGYTAMMQRDEQLAMTAVRRHQRVLETCVPMHRGHIHQYYGDGSLSVFNSATDAVRCAFELQKQFLESPEVPVRMGIHIGEIYTEDGKIFGDGVNLASRIESIGQPGAVLFSRHVYEKVRNHSEFQIKPVGTFEFKNVDDPLEVYALSNPEIRMPDLKRIEGKLKEQRKHNRKAMLVYAVGLLVILAIVGIYLYPKDGKTTPDMGYLTSVAVLPFENLSTSPEDAFPSVGLAEDILTQLAQIQGLKVISRSSSMKYQEPEEAQKSIKQKAKELNVENLLIGSVQRYGNDLRVNVKLVDGKEETILWAEEFNRKIEDILNVQRDIAITVADKLKIQLTRSVKDRFQNPGNVNPDAYVNYLKGREALLRSSGSEEELNTAISYIEMAIHIDSTFAKAWAGLANCYAEAIFWHRIPDAEALPKATSAAVHALQLDPDLGDAYAVLGSVDMYSNNLKAAERSLRRALELSPNSDVATERMAWVEFFKGNKDKGVELQDRAIQLDPLSTRYKGALGTAYYVMRRYDEGIRRSKEFLKQHPGDNFILWAIAYLYAGKGDCDSSIYYLNQRTIGLKTNWVYAYCYAKENNMKAAQEILDTMIVKDRNGFVPPFMMAVAYTALGDYNDALDKLDMASGAGGESFFAWGIKSDPMFMKLHGNPRFDKVVSRLESMYQK